jgi:hypothetical protein
MGLMSTSGPCSTADANLWRMGKTVAKGPTLAEIEKLRAGGSGEAPMRQVYNFLMNGTKR